jgi:dTMP kinase
VTGKFITLEGGEGVGKSTQAARLVSSLEANGISVIRTREPGGTPKAERLRNVLLQGKAAKFGPMAEAVLFSAARLDHLETLIRPALVQGTWVICDRFADSTRAYQGASGALDERTIDTLERVVVGATRPDLTLILDLPPEIGLARAVRRLGEAKQQASLASQELAPPQELDRFERDTLQIHAARRQAFLAIAAAEPDRCVIIDASKDADTIANEIWGHLQKLLPVALSASPEVTVTSLNHKRKSGSLVKAASSDG